MPDREECCIVHPERIRAQLKLLKSETIQKPVPIETKAERIETTLKLRSGTSVDDESALLQEIATSAALRLPPLNRES